jgi:hypothetical protein
MGRTGIKRIPSPLTATWSPISSYSWWLPIYAVGFKEKGSSNRLTLDSPIFKAGYFLSQCL